MGEAIGQILPFAVGVALSPIPIIGVVLMVGTPAGTRNGPAFLIGWIGGIGVPGAIVILVASGAGASSNGAPADWVSWVKIALGALLVAVAFNQWRARPAPGAEPELPGWMKSVDHFTPGRSIALGFALSAIMAVLCLVIAAKLIGDAISGLSA
jgi:Sap, sulfolipid-1-addressing protein